MFLVNFIVPIFLIILLSLIVRFLSKTILIHSLVKGWRFLEDKCYVHQLYKVPKFNDNMQENQLYRRVRTYLNSLPRVEDSAFANLFSCSKSAEINLIPDDNQPIVDKFLGARVQWRIENCGKFGVKSLVLKIRKNDKRRILVPYLQHIHQAFDEIETKRKEVRLFVNVEHESQRDGRWRSTSFTHPATIDTIVMDSDLKSRIQTDLENFLKSRQYYHRLGRVWKRSYLLYGPAGTGKSTFVAAMAKFLSYDIYEINLHRIANDSDLKYILLQTANKSLLVIEHLDRYLREKSTAVSLSGILDFMDGLFSCCGEERVMVFTANGKEDIDANILRPGRIDVHVNFPLCDFSAFKSLANSHLGLKDHKLFPQLQEIFQTGASLSQAEISEIMISNRSSPSRALKTVITALGRQSDPAGRVGRKLNGLGSGRATEEPVEPGLFGNDEQDGNRVRPAKDIKNLCGFLRTRSGRKASIGSLDIDIN